MKIINRCCLFSFLWLSHYLLGVCYLALLIVTIFFFVEKLNIFLFYASGHLGAQAETVCPQIFSGNNTTTTTESTESFSPTENRASTMQNLFSMGNNSLFRVYFLGSHNTFYRHLRKGLVFIS